jgi:hypothetical protein
MEDPSLDLPSDTSTMDDGSSEDTGTMDERQTVLESQQALADAGALDSAFLVRLTAPDKHVTTEERAALRFLRATETGAGCSRRQVEALLHHVQLAATCATGGVARARCLIQLH